MNSDPHIWFSAKRYGGGWGFPVSWEGWVALAAFMVLMVAGVFLFPPDQEVGRFVAFTCVLCIGLIVVAWLQAELRGTTHATPLLLPVEVSRMVWENPHHPAYGEPPRWRWGQD